jgi:hypothetical protein
LYKLRTDRPQRPVGARLPWLRSNKSKSSSDDVDQTPLNQHPVLDPIPQPPRASSALSHHSTASDLVDDHKSELRPSRSLVRQHSGKTTTRQASNGPRPIIDTAPYIPYIEGGQRWMERQESRSISRAMRDMDSKEEQQLQAAAQNEASELVWKHQNPELAESLADAPHANPDAPTSYRAHLRREVTQERIALIGYQFYHDTTRRRWSTALCRARPTP